MIKRPNLSQIADTKSRLERIIPTLKGLSGHDLDKISEHLVGTGTLPTIDAARAFLADIMTGKVQVKAEELEGRMRAIDAEIDRLQAELDSSGRPWMMAIEMQFKVMREMAKYLGEMRREGGLGYQESIIAKSLGLIKGADTYSWSDEVTSAVLAASTSIPAGDQNFEGLVPSPVGWWWFNSPVKIPEYEREIQSILWGPSDTNSGPGLIVLFFSKTDENPVLLPRLSATWRPGESWSQLLARNAENVAGRLSPEDQEFFKGAVLDSRIDMIDQLGRFFIAGCIWTQQRILEFSHGNVERHRRKQLARENKLDKVNTEVKIVRLRRVERTADPTKAEGEPVEWSCRWLVSGHWRKQYYASTGEHKLIYILPFVKGPEDKPLKVPTHTVFSVDR